MSDIIHSAHDVNPPSIPIDLDTVDDMLDTGPTHERWNHIPEWLTSFRPHQVDAVRSIVDAYSRTNVVILDAPVGCLSGDTVINVNRGGNGRKYPIHEVVTKFNGGTLPGGKGSARGWNPDIPTMIQRADGDVARLGELDRAYESGVKVTFTLTTDSGRTIRATATHPFLTEAGEWLELSDLSVGDRVRVNVGKGVDGPAEKKRYAMQSGMRNHPNAIFMGKGIYRVARHRMVVEADLNNLDYDVYVKAIKAGDVDGFVFLDPDTQHVHHVNHDHRDNRLSNLAVIDPIEHQRHHSAEHVNNVLDQIRAETIVSITEYGEEMTYDLGMADEPHNFIANGFVVHNSGKSLIAELARQCLATTSLYVCTTRSLQRQLRDDFPHTRLLEGRANYPTQYGPADVNAGDCTGSPESACMFCEYRESCPYEVAKVQAMTAATGILNTAYFLTESNGPGRFGHRNPRGLVVIDEADELESALMGHVELQLDRFWQDRTGITPPKVKTASAKSNDWAEWVDESIDLMRAYTRQAQSRVKSNDVRSIRHAKSAFRKLDGLVTLKEELPNGRWVYDGYDRDRPTIIFKPVMVDSYGQRMVWRHGRRFLLMSGSVISSNNMADELGVDHHESVTVNVDWDPARRPVFVAPISNVTYKNKASAYPRLAKAVEGIAMRHPDERGLVHCVSYALTRHIAEAIGGGKSGDVSPVIDRPVFWYLNAKEREAAIAGYEATEHAVMLAPSLDRGYDGKDDLVRWQVICKVPYPSLGDKQVSQRANLGRRGKVWYSISTVRSIIQMLGRGVRHAEDHCTTYVLDDQFVTNILKKNRRIVPQYVLDAIVLKGRAKSLLNGEGS